MRIAITASTLAQQWEHADLDHMADAATMLWEQANDFASREPSSKDELSEAISRIFEPLLTWTGHFKLCAQLALARSKLASFKTEPWEAHLVAFEALAFQGKFQDDYPWQRETTFGRAQNTYAHLMRVVPVLTPQDVGRVAHAWFLIGMENMARETLRTSADIATTRQFYTDSLAPLNWSGSFISLSWLHLLRDVELELS